MRCFLMTHPHFRPTPIIKGCAALEWMQPAARLGLFAFLCFSFYLFTRPPPKDLTTMVCHVGCWRYAELGLTLVPRADHQSWRQDPFRRVRLHCRTQQLFCLLIRAEKSAANVQVAADDPLELCQRPGAVKTESWAGKKVVVFAVPGAFTPTCQEGARLVWCCCMDRC